MQNIFEDCRIIMPSEIIPHDELEGVLLVHKAAYEDDRGFFSEIFKDSEICNIIDRKFEQANFSMTREVGTIRGLHFQKPPHEQGKLITVTSGKIYDVAVDIRRESKTFGMWTSFVIDSSQKLAVYLPEGFAHGFQSLEKDSQVLYFCTSEYSPSSECSIKWNDSEIGIRWPVDNPKLSKKDAVAPPLSDWGKKP